MNICLFSYQKDYSPNVSGVLGGTLKFLKYQFSPSIFGKKTLVNLFTLAASPLSRGIDVQLCVRIGWLQPLLYLLL